MLELQGPRETTRTLEVLRASGVCDGLTPLGRTLAPSDHYLENLATISPLMARRKTPEIAQVGTGHAMNEIGRWTNR